MGSRQDEVRFEALECKSAKRDGGDKPATCGGRGTADAYERRHGGGCGGRGGGGVECGGTVFDGSGRRCVRAGVERAGEPGVRAEREWQVGGGGGRRGAPVNGLHWHSGRQPLCGDGAGCGERMAGITGQVREYGDGGCAAAGD